MTSLKGDLRSIMGTPFGGVGHAVLIFSRVTRAAFDSDSVILQLHDRIEMPEEADGKFRVDGLDPGPIRIELEGGTVHNHGWNIDLPDEGVWSLTDLVDAQVDWSPAVIGRAEAAAREARDHADRAEAGADRVGTAEQVGVWASEASSSASDASSARYGALTARDAARTASDAAEGHANSAATAESNAATSETNAKQSETNAGDYAAVATTAATEAVDAMERATDLAGGDFATHEYVDAALDDPRVPQVKHGTDLSWAVSDGEHSPLAVTRDGSVHLSRVDNPTATLIANEVSERIGITHEDMGVEDYMPFRVSDGSHVALAVTESGDVDFGRLSPAALDYLTGALDITPNAQPETRLIADTSTGDLFAVDATTGQRSKLATAPQNVRTVGDALTWEDGGKTWWQSTLDDGPWRAVDTTRLAIWGSSSAQRLGTPLSAGLAAHGLTDRYLGGMPSERSEHTLGRMGAVPFILDATIQAVADTDVPVVLRGVTTAGSFAIPGRFGGVRGTLRMTSGIGFYFKSEESVTIPAGAEFTPDAVEWRDAMQILNIGKNNLASGQTAQSAIEATVTAADYSRTLGDLYLVMGHFLDTAWQTTYTAYQNTLVVNAELKDRYGSRFLDLEAFTSSPDLWDLAGITPTPEDLQAQANRLLPPSVAADPSHMTPYGYELVVNHLIIPALESKGWI